MTRTFVTGRQVAQCPSKSRLVEAIMIRLTGEADEQRARGPESPYLSKWKVLLLKYNALRNTVIKSRLYKDTQLQLFPINETISKWYKNNARKDEIKLLLQGLAIPDPPLAAAEPLHEPLERPAQSTAPFPANPNIRPEEPELVLSTKHPIHYPEVQLQQDLVEQQEMKLPKTTAWRKRRRAEEQAREMAKSKGLPSPKKTRQAYTCKKCQKPQTKETQTGHSQYYGQTYCPNEPGQLPREQWLKEKAEERKAKNELASQIQTQSQQN